MTDVSGRSSSGSGHDTSLAELRRLIVGVEQRQLAHIAERLDDPIIRAQETASVLADAVRVQTARDSRLTDALQPAIGNALEFAVSRDPAPFANALFPVLGPAIRAAVADMLARALASLDEALTHTFSVQGLRWRMEAWRTGKPFAEVAMLRTLVYRVEQVILIDRSTSLPLLHLLADDIHAKDAAHRSAMMSGMLAAIRAFANDALGAGTEQTLDSFTVGSQHVWIEQGPRAKVAAVISGSPPAQLRLTLREVVEDLHQQFATLFARFTGDTSSFELARPVLQRALQSRRSAPAPRVMARAWTVLVIVALALLNVTGIWLYRGYRASQYVAQLRAEPGVVVTEHARSGWGFAVAGLRDPDARDTTTLRNAIASDAIFTAASMREQWAPYLSLDPRLTLTRATRRLQPTTRVSLQVRGDTLVATGVASFPWRAAARGAALSVPGVRAFDDTGLQLDVRERADSLVRILNGARILFPLGSAVMSDAEASRLRDFTSQLRDIVTMVALDSGVVAVRVAGYADSTGTATRNTMLAVARAAAVRAALASSGVPSALVTDDTPSIADAPSITAARPSTRLEVHIDWKNPRPPAP